ncbi:SWF or SNF family helicase [Streptomyces sp. NPDC102279]|uniref:SWIM zinc finger family protein n=1 Tax=Streptomyces sp. NPDC102279 TaxID=3366153 RepID=UPI0037FC87CD
MTDRDEERTFGALQPARGRAFARTWWGRAWLRALEDAALDSEQVRMGRRLARAGAVGAVSVRPGRVTAVVEDNDGTTHRADVLLHELSEEQWDRFLGMAAERSGHVAALLDGDMPPHLVEDAAAAGVELLPGLGDLDAECECGAWDHCGHTAALCYQAALLLDQDPFVLLLMRGRGERALLDALQRRGEQPADHPGESGGGVDAVEAYATGDILPPLPTDPALPERPGTPPSLKTEGAPAPGVDPVALEFIAHAAAHEAHLILAEALGRAPGGGAAETESVSLSQDAVRLAACDPPESVAERLAAGSGREREELSLAVRAWRYGGVSALSALEDEWSVGTESLARARASLHAAWEEDERPRLRADRNRWTAADTGTQLRLGRDGRWWPYRKERGRWTPAGPATADPATAIATAGEDPMTG